MPEKSFHERTEPATPRRRQEARREGKVARSQELNSAFVLLAGLGLLAVAGPAMLGRCAHLARRLLLACGQIELRPELLPGYLSDGLPQVLLILAPLAGAVLIVGLLVNVAQVGFVLSWKPLAPRLEALSPGRGFKRIFSKQGGVELLKSLLKVALISVLAYLTLRTELPRLTPLTGSDPLVVFGMVATITLKLGLRVGLALLLLALGDYAFQRWDYERGLMMSRRELEEELRQTEGDPRVRARVRAVQRQMARRRMMEQVKTADVVVVNPTQLAVALRYDRAQMRAPQVVAKGARLLAQRIREIAGRHEVPIVEDRPLARSLFKIPVDEEIPVALYRVVAELLAYVYRLKARRSALAEAV